MRNSHAGMPAILIPYLITQKSSAGVHSRAVYARFAGTGVKTQRKGLRRDTRRAVAAHAMRVE